MKGLCSISSCCVHLSSVFISLAEHCTQEHLMRLYTYTIFPKVFCHLSSHPYELEWKPILNRHVICPPFTAMTASTLVEAVDMLQWWKTQDWGMAEPRPGQPGEVLTQMVAEFVPTSKPVPTSWVGAPAPVPVPRRRADEQPPLTPPAHASSRPEPMDSVDSMRGTACSPRAGGWHQGESCSAGARGQHVVWTCLVFTRSQRLY